LSIARAISILSALSNEETATKISRKSEVADAQASTTHFEANRIGWSVFTLFKQVAEAHRSAPK
jgi:hypothetical protein